MYLLVPIMLDECIKYLEKKSCGPFSYEIIVVSDGSRDGTVAKALKYSQKYTVEKFRVLELVENRGKGGAIRMVVSVYNLNQNINESCYFL